jgi:hypothetical protein
MKAPFCKILGSAHIDADHAAWHYYVIPNSQIGDSMKTLLCLVVLIFAAAPILHAQTAPDAAELTALLNEFLVGASRSDPAVHDRFWADDLIYTRSAGRRVSKADVMRDVRSAPAPKPGDPTTTYTAEDVRIQQYGDTAVMAFRLVGVTKNGSDTQTSQNLNTGTFVKRNGKWQVVAWQSTRMPRAEQESKDQVLAVEAAFHRAMLSSDDDLKRLESIVAENYVWTQYDGRSLSRVDLISGLRNGTLRYSKLETKVETVAVFGDAAVVRGVIGSRLPATGGGQSVTFETRYTMTLANAGSGWKIVAMHSSRSASP